MRSTGTYSIERKAGTAARAPHGVASIPRAPQHLSAYPWPASPTVRQLNTSAPTARMSPTFAPNYGPQPIRYRRRKNRPFFLSVMAAVAGSAMTEAIGRQASTLQVGRAAASRCFCVSRARARFYRVFLFCRSFYRLLSLSFCVLFRSLSSLRWRNFLYVQHDGERLPGRRRRHERANSPTTAASASRLIP